MATFQDIEAACEDSAIRLRFRLERAGVLGWQVFDPATGAFLSRANGPAFAAPT